MVYGATVRRDWRTVSVADVGFEAAELTKQLLPTLHRGALPRDADANAYGSALVEECRSGLGTVLPLRAAEVEFLDHLLEEGKVEPALLTSDRDLQQRIESQPLLAWKAHNVRRYQGLA